MFRCPQACEWSPSQCWMECQWEEKGKGNNLKPEDGELTIPTPSSSSTDPEESKKFKCEPTRLVFRKVSLSSYKDRAYFYLTSC